MSEKYDIVGIGNAIVDVVSFVSEAGLAPLGLARGGMTLIDEARAETLYAGKGPSTEMSGGSVANSLAGIASLGGKTAFIGKVRDDQLGNIFRHDMRSIGVTFDTPAATSGPTTARCLIYVTPDAQRTMGTYIGACANVRPDDIDEQLIAQGKVTYVEGYLWDQPSAKEAIRKALAAAKRHGKKVAFSLSDSFCVHRHRKEFLELIAGHIDILFANEEEAKALLQVDDGDEAIAMMQGKCDVVAVTRSEKGSVIVTKDEIINVAAVPVNKLVDTTGAGDLYAAGFLFGLLRGEGLKHAAELGSACAAEIISQVGARSLRPLKTLLVA